MTHRNNAWNIVIGNSPMPDESIGEIYGARNDYNSRGRGRTDIRRVFRDNSWEWLSSPASRNRFLAADRRDTQYGEVWEGEIIAEYTMGNKKPDYFAVVVKNADGNPAIAILEHVKLRNGNYKLSCKESKESENFLPGNIEVSSPYWR